MKSVVLAIAVWLGSPAGLVRPLCWTPVAQVLHLGLGEGTFRELNEELALQQNLESQFQMK